MLMNHTPGWVHWDIEKSAHPGGCRICRESLMISRSSNRVKFAARASGS